MFCIAQLLPAFGDATYTLLRFVSIPSATQFVHGAEDRVRIFLKIAMGKRCDIQGEKSVKSLLRMRLYSFGLLWPHASLFQTQRISQQAVTVRSNSTWFQEKEPRFAFIAVTLKAYVYLF